MAGSLHNLDRIDRFNGIDGCGGINRSKRIYWGRGNERHQRLDRSNGSDWYNRLNGDCGGCGNKRKQRNKRKQCFIRCKCSEWWQQRRLLDQHYYDMSLRS